MLESFVSFVSSGNSATAVAIERWPFFPSGTIATPLFTAFSSASFRSRRAPTSTGSLPTDRRTRLCATPGNRRLRSAALPCRLPIQRRASHARRRTAKNAAIQPSKLCFDSFGEIDFAVGHRCSLTETGISVGVTDSQVLDTKKLAERVGFALGRL